MTIQNKYLYLHRINQLKQKQMSRERTIIVTLEDAIVDVHGWYVEPSKGDYYTPSTSAEFEIYNVYYKDVDIFPCLSGEVIEDLQNRCLTLLD